MLRRAAILAPGGGVPPTEAVMATSDRFEIDEGLAFDDVLLRPGHSTVLPGQVDIGTRLTRTP